MQGTSYRENSRKRRRHWLKSTIWLYCSFAPCTSMNIYWHKQTPDESSSTTWFQADSTGAVANYVHGVHDGACTRYINIFLDLGAKHDAYAVCSASDACMWMFCLPMLSKNEKHYQNLIKNKSINYQHSSSALTPAAIICTLRSMCSHTFSGLCPHIYHDI